MRRSRPYFPLELILVCAALSARAPAAAAQPRDASRKSAAAANLGGASIRVDGRLDEEIWLKAEAITDFTQKEPVEGAVPTDAMEVRFLYDETALYVGARMSTKNAPEIQAPLGRRDNNSQSEHIWVWLDTFLDRRTAVAFGVTAAGVRLDSYHPDDNEDNADAGFDAVWEARTMESADGWTAELWIPFSQLRFTPAADQIWGLNIRRFRPTLDEEDYWVLVPRTERVFVSRFGDLRGVSGVKPTRRIEVLPYVAGAATVNGNRDPRNPFDDGRNLTSRVGGDVKMGLGPNLTLEATINPDFGQVEADPAEVNLTAFETRFSEKRPFFLEGAQLFTINHPNFYYSRRIGARPIGTASADFVDYPSSSTIVAAGKLTGRLRSRTSIGLISAATDEESAGMFSLGAPQQTSVRVAPRAYWTVGRVRQEFGRLGSTVGLIISTVHRDVADGDPLADLLTRNAVAAGADTVLRFKGGEYQFWWAGGGSFLNGSPKAVERFQRGSSHYAQRPDKEYAQIDPTRTSLSGFSMQTRLEKVSGRHWLWNVGTKFDTPFFETNDVANFNAADGVMPTGSVTWRETRPGRIFRSYSFGMSQTWEWNLGGDRQSAQIRPSANFTWANYWTTSFTFTRTFRTNDAALTRGGPLMQKPRSWTTAFSFGNRSTSQTRVSANTTIGGNEDGGSTRRVSGDFSFRPGPRWQLSAGPFYERLTEAQQYVQTLTGGGRAATFNNRYIFSFIDRSTVSTEFRMGLTVRPDMNLDVYAEPFAASGRYYDYGELLRPAVRDRITYGATPGTTMAVGSDGSRVVSEGGTTFTLRNRDFNTLSFRSNVVLRWEWRPGSTLYLVWQQDRSGTEAIGSHVGVGDMFDSLSAPGSNFFVVKTSFWLPIK
jgi:hypothetical protein